MGKHELKEKNCEYCGKLFFNLDYTHYVYKRDGKYYCSYTCWTKSEKEEKPKPKRNKIMN